MKPKITGLNEGRPTGRIVYGKETETKSAGDSEPRALQDQRSVRELRSAEMQGTWTTAAS